MSYLFGKITIENEMANMIEDHIMLYSTDVRFILHVVIASTFSLGIEEKLFYINTLFVKLAN